jgi:hypothetical protein
MRTLILAFNDRGFCLGVNAEDDICVLKLENHAQAAIGSIVESDPEAGLHFGFKIQPADRNYQEVLSCSLTAAISALVNLGQPEYVQTKEITVTVRSDDAVGRIKAALLPLLT